MDFCRTGRVAQGNKCVRPEPAGTCIFEGKVASAPKAIVRLIRKRALDVVRVGLESGPTSVWLTHTLLAEGLPVVCLDARHAQAILSVRPNKSDRSDARGLAEMVRVGWFKEGQVKSLTAHERTALLIARHQLVEMRVRNDNPLRGILKTFGLVIGKCGHGQIGQRAEQLAEGHPGIDCVVASLVAVRDSLRQQIAIFDRAIRRLVKADDTARRLMTVPGIGPVVALAYMSVIDDPKRFDHARDVGAYHYSCNFLLRAQLPVRLSRRANERCLTGSNIRSMGVITARGEGPNASFVHARSRSGVSRVVSRWPAGCCTAQDWLDAG
jgi:transposase